MTGAQLKSLREANGLSRRQLALALGFRKTTSPSKQIEHMERKGYVPETVVHRINRMVAEGRLVVENVRGRTVSA